MKFFPRQRLRWSKSTHPEAGFTLLELLVIIVMVGILAAIAGPSWLGYLNRQRVSSVRADLVDILRSIQEDAQQQSSYRTLWIMPIDSAKKPAADRGYPVIYYGGQNYVDIAKFTAQRLGSTNIPEDTVQIIAYKASADGNSWEAATADADLTLPCDGFNEACFQYNYTGNPTNPTAELLPISAGDYGKSGTQQIVPFKVDVFVEVNGNETAKQCVVVTNLLGAIQSRRGDECNTLPPKSWVEGS